jgi:putative DNA primase/helicase
MMDLKSLARALGGESTGGHVLAPGPGHSKRDRSLAVFIDPNSPDLFRVHSFAGDGWRVCRDHVKALIGGEQGQYRNFGIGISRETQRSAAGILTPSARAIELWSQGVPIAGTEAETYLASRGVQAPLGDHVLRHHAACPFKLEDGTTIFPPTMIGFFQNIITNVPTGVHRTALKPDGTRKADVPGGAKRMLGRAKGAAIKLSSDEQVTTGLGLTEGIETGLSVLNAGWAPVWALGSAGAISTFPVLAGVESLTIFADHDPAGIRAARECQARWREAGRECRILAPPCTGTDWNDEARA